MLTLPICLEIKNIPYIMYFARKLNGTIESNSFVVSDILKQYILHLHLTDEA